MQRRDLCGWLGASLTSLTALSTLTALTPEEALAFNLSEGDAASGVREALERGAQSALSNLGRTDGFLGNPQVRIDLPGSLRDAARLLRTTGQGKRLDDLVTAMNRAAEQAMPEARQLLVSTVRNISVEDAVRIVRGGDNAVTRFFEDKTREPLTGRFLPIVTKATERQSLADKYNAVAGKAANFGLVRREDANLQSYVTDKALDGLYYMIGEEEKKIRKDPIGTGSALLRKVFG
ncbi:DUF4197 domain-containing protein [Roseateles depolymerans]|uniref:Uncharacterized protein n=1 Tax=Roseateles depolymerans TaxID=76731 RepID=A0A0U3MPN5_9BURK|nr:DUF4197 domain-containing protein [Roseateles depolymerans]ALV04867.1 hypothetical protein RD2015_364 [Roseateles depolymerans]REG15121.1 uncharacterized protein DUF4197 [Roseateles depolymerans]